EQGPDFLSGSNIGLIEPKKLPNPVRESKTHQELHRELLFSHRRGLLPEHKPELQKVLETRRFKQLKQQQESQRPLTDLEEELRKRHQMLEQVFKMRVSCELMIPQSKSSHCESSVSHSPWSPRTSRQSCCSDGA
uniref:Protein FAM107B n=1 Tax=Gopherus evgoodei TaxID=1825980 RepID=A0A8C4Y2M9_9SAUR